MLTEREQLAIAHFNAALDAEDEGRSWSDCGETDAQILLDAIRRLAAQPAPLADAELAELERLIPFMALPWARTLDEYDVTIFEDTNRDGIRPNPYSPICRIEDLEDGLSDEKAEYIVATCNALPGLLARLRAAEARNAVVAKVLDEQRIYLLAECRLAHANGKEERFKQLETQVLELNNIEEIILGQLTVKGGQQQC